MDWLQGSGLLRDVLQGDGLGVMGCMTMHYGGGLHSHPMQLVRLHIELWVLFVQSVSAQNDHVLQTPFRRTMTICTTAGIGIIVASTLLVEHTKSGEYRGRHGGSYK